MLSNDKLLSLIAGITNSSAQQRRLAGTAATIEGKGRVAW
jgi:hypothetical protein